MHQDHWMCHLIRDALLLHRLRRQDCKVGVHERATECKHVCVSAHAA